ncbi:MAG: prepilin-type N-terminal cleavage/methylation domain-containing protein [Polymorphobacter sp.]
MPISATGNRPSRDAGFTLVELLVVLVVIGLMAATVVLTLPDPRGRLADDGTALAARLVAARDLSIIGGLNIGVRFDAAGYSFEQRRGENWAPVTERALAPRRWTTGVAATTAVEGGAALEFDATGLATPAEIILRRDGASSVVTVSNTGQVRVDAR